MSKKKFLLEEEQLPKYYYNIAADLPVELPPALHPGTMQPIGPNDLEPLFPTELIFQEVSKERNIEIPVKVREVYRIYRPSPLIRATGLEKILDTPAKIYYKYEGNSPTGSHKPNTAIPQAYYNALNGVKKITTETGAGQWGSALSYAASIFGIDVTVFMVAVSYMQKPYRKAMIETFGGKVYASPSHHTNAGRSILSVTPDSPGSLGIAISEAVEIAASNNDTKYALGSVLNHVLLHQTIIGNEAIQQFEMTGDYPDIVIGCAGGGSNFAGFCFPFIGEKLRGGKNIRAIAVEPSACPSLTQGEYKYDFGDTAKTTPLIKMHTLGNEFIPPSIHAGGLRYHGMAPLVSHLKELDLIEAKAVTQNECFKAGIMFAKSEGIIPAPEANHAVKAAIDEALLCKKSGEKKIIAFNLCGHGYFDMASYSSFLNNELIDFAQNENEIQNMRA
ncbi:MAG: TrpB-like pyridoxal phosphate-dependent enzyme [Ignavibacteriaceae bacterium]|nr:TrpB-like pyridoxal phosphate-dependent enzyme [Ignavibacteriaceae bacterium]